MTTSMTIGAVAKHLTVTTATIRNWSKLAADYLSSQSIKRTGKRFTPEDVAILEQVQALLGDGYIYKDIPPLIDPIPQLLDNNGVSDSRKTDETPSPKPNKTTDMVPVSFFEDYVNTLVKPKDDLIIELKQDKQKLAAENAWLRLPWYRKIFTKPPD